MQVLSAIILVLLVIKVIVGLAAGKFHLSDLFYIPLFLFVFMSYLKSESGKEDNTENDQAEN